MQKFCNNLSLEVSLFTVKKYLKGIRVENNPHKEIIIG